jgi:hypothetical protein
MTFEYTIRTTDMERICGMPFMRWTLSSALSRHEKNKERMTALKCKQ